VLGVVVDPRRLEQLSGQDGRQEITPDRLKSVIHHFSNLAPAEPKWLELASFAARYYRKPFGQIAVGLVPKWLRDLKNLIPKKESGPCGPALHHIWPRKAGAGDGSRDRSDATACIAICRCLAGYRDCGLA
jgi:hypothetical protein